jgi:TetR/AcrR family transcriptional regulator, copper-responsive repressor
MAELFWSTEFLVIDKKMQGTPRPRGRPSSFDKEAALDAAVPLFWRHGYEGTSVAALTAAMGIAPPTLYTAFGSKEGLYREVLERYVKLQGAEARSDAFRREPLAYKAIAIYLHDVAQEFANPAKPPGCMVSTSALHCGADSEAAARTTAALRAATTEMLEAKFAEAKRAGQLSEDADPKALAQYYGAVIQGMSAQACDGADAATLIGVADIALRAWPGDRSSS